MSNQLLERRRVLMASTGVKLVNYIEFHDGETITIPRSTTWPLSLAIRMTIKAGTSTQRIIEYLSESNTVVYSLGLTSGLKVSAVGFNGGNAYQDGNTIEVVEFQSRSDNRWYFRAYSRKVGNTSWNGAVSKYLDGYSTERTKIRFGRNCTDGTRLHFARIADHSSNNGDRAYNAVPDSNYLPAILDEEIGLYDAVSGNFYSGDGNGYLTYG